MRLRTLAVSAFLAAMPAFAFAQTVGSGEGKALMRACGADIQNFCHGVQIGGGNVRTCLRSHLRDLSPDCKGQLVTAHAKRKEQMEQQQQENNAQPQY